MYKKTKYQQQKNKKKIILFFSLIILIIMLGVTTWLFLYIKHNIYIKEIIFIGNQHLSRADLYKILKVNINDPLFGISSTHIYKNLITSPWIKEVRIRKELSGKIIIQISEAIPSAILYKSKKPYFIDSSGVILEEIAEPSFFFLPIIREIDPLNNKNAYREALLLISILKEKKIMSYSGQFEITGKYPDELTIKIENILVKFGAGNYEQKFERLEKVKEEIKNKYNAIDYIDLRFSDQVIVKPLNQ